MRPTYYGRRVAALDPDDNLVTTLGPARYHLARTAG